MRFFDGRYLPGLPSMHYNFRRVDLATNGRWAFITPKIDVACLLPGICHNQNPLRKVDNKLIPKVISRILSDTREWLLYDCVEPMTVSSRLSLQDHSLVLQNASLPTIADLELDNLKILLDATKQLPLTLSSPAVIPGVRSRTFDCDGSAITNRELDDLKILMAPHLRLVSMVFGGGGNDEDAILPTWATLFAIFLKARVVHMIAFTLLRAEGGPVMNACVVDNLPIMIMMNDFKDLEDRLRLAVALFTLQRRVVRFSTHWGDVV
ncbi:unnamed protein product [Somion occarium]|uniref:Uncharacterized protein n=1 Tax=Somion occarium TaxID=3059160 RepID=A0ABP1DEZ7_9APHY